MKGFVFAALAALVVMAIAAFGLGEVCTGQRMLSGSRGVPIGFAADVDMIRPQHAILRSGDLQRVQLKTQAPPAALSDWQRSFLCQMKASDIVLLGFALFLVLALLYQAAWMRRAVQSGARASRVVEDALLAAQRPYVFLRELQVNLTKNPISDDIQSCAIQPVFENAGVSPTRRGRSHVNWKFFQGSIPADFDFPDLDEVGNRISSYDSFKPLIVGPKATALSPVLVIDPDLLRQVRDLQGRILIWGWVEYDDASANAKRHRAEFCYQLVVTGSPPSFVGFSQFKAFNGTDGDVVRKATIVTQPV